MAKVYPCIDYRTSAGVEGPFVKTNDVKFVSLDEIVNVKLLDVLQEAGTVCMCHRPWRATSD
jgi:hypothetical protein